MTWIHGRHYNIYVLLVITVYSHKKILSIHFYWLLLRLQNPFCWISFLLEIIFSQMFFFFSCAIQAENRPKRSGYRNKNNNREQYIFTKESSHSDNRSPTSFVWIFMFCFRFKHPQRSAVTARLCLTVRRAHIKEPLKNLQKCIFFFRCAYRILSTVRVNSSPTVLQCVSCQFIRYTTDMKIIQRLSAKFT